MFVNELSEDQMDPRWQLRAERLTRHNFAHAQRRQRYAVLGWPVKAPGVAIRLLPGRTLVVPEREVQPP